MNDQQTLTKFQPIIKSILQLSSTEQLELMTILLRILFQRSQEETVTETKITLANSIGLAQGSFATPEEADEFIRREREAWTS